MRKKRFHLRQPCSSVWVCRCFFQVPMTTSKAVWLHPSVPSPSYSAPSIHLREKNCSSRGGRSCCRSQKHSLSKTRACGHRDPHCGRTEGPPRPGAGEQNLPRSSPLFFLLRLSFFLKTYPPPTPHPHPHPLLTAL